MQINIMMKEEKVFLDIDGSIKPFDFNTMDELIDLFVGVNKGDLNILLADESLINYKDLLNNVFDETKKTDFINAYNNLNKTEISNEEIEEIINDNCGQ